MVNKRIWKKTIFLAMIASSLTVPAVAITSCSSNYQQDPKIRHPYNSLQSDVAKNCFNTYNASFFNDIYFDNYQDSEHFFKEDDPTSHASNQLQNPNLLVNDGTNVYNYEEYAKNTSSYPDWLQQQYNRFGKELDGFPILVPTNASQDIDKYGNNYRNFFINPDVAKYFSWESNYYVTAQALVDWANLSNNALGKLKLSGLYLRDNQRCNSVKILLHPLLWDTLINGDINDNKKINTVDLSFNDLLIAPNFASIVYFDNYSANQTPSGWLFEDYKLGTIDLRHNEISVMNLNPEVSISDFNNWQYTDEWYSPGLVSIVNQIDKKSINDNGVMVDYNRMPWLEHTKWSTTEMTKWDNGVTPILRERKIYKYLAYTSSIHSISDPIESLVQDLLSVGLYQKDGVNASGSDFHNFLMQDHSDFFNNTLWTYSQDHNRYHELDEAAKIYINQNHLTSQMIYDDFAPDEWLQEHKGQWDLPWMNEPFWKDNGWFQYYCLPIGITDNVDFIYWMSWNSEFISNYGYFNGVYSGCARSMSVISKRDYFNPDNQPENPNNVSSWIQMLLSEFNTTSVYSFKVPGFKIDPTGLAINILVYGLLGIVCVTLVTFIAIKHLKKHNDSKKQYIRGKMPKEK